VAGTLLKIALGLAVAWLAIKAGVAMLRSLGRPPAEPPPPGELRRVNLRYRCSLCGMEMKMMLAADELPPPPRHCQEEMDLLAPVE
jgi:hypothetical protein